MSISISSTYLWNVQNKVATPAVGASDPQFIVAVKKGIIEALRATFTSTYPDPVLQNMSISMEYPEAIESYPGIWCSFSFRDLQNMGLNNYVFTDPVSGQRFQMWMFGGTVTLTIVALSSKERDTIADKIIQMYAFHSINTQADTFRRFLSNWPYIYMNTNQNVLRPGGQSTTVGAPWQPDIIVYEDTYEFDIIGQFKSNFSNGDLLVLHSIVPKPHASGTTSNINDGNGVWVGKLATPDAIGNPLGL